MTDPYPAELDYAFVARYAEVVNGNLTAVAASYTHVEVVDLPSSHSLYVAGRIRCSPEADVTVSISVKSPEDAYQFEAEYPLDADTHGAHPYGDPARIGLLFAIGGPIPLVAAGDYSVDVRIDDVTVRSLLFNVAPRSSQ